MRRRKPTLLGIVGTFLLGSGAIGLTWGSLQQFSPDRVGIAAILLGAIALAFISLKKKNLAADEIFNIGRERGEADGYEMGFTDGFEEGRRDRPVVVPMHQKCADCGSSLPSRFVGSVADRG